MLIEDKIADGSIVFEEGFRNEFYKTITLYFIAPTELLDGKYPEAESAEISIEFPIYDQEARSATVMFSPTKDSSDYDWYDVDLSYEIVEKLIGMADKTNLGSVCVPLKE